MTDFISPVMRIVQGSVLEAQTKDNKGQPLKIKTGPNAGQLTQRFFIACAVPKTQAAWWLEQPLDGNGQPITFFADIYNASRAGYPQHFDPATGQCKHPRFAFKVMDGDGLDNDGNPNNQKPGMAGHWIVKFSSTFAPKVWMNGGYVTDLNAIKRGHFVRVMGNMSPNIGSDVPGLYINHNGVEFIAYGQEIVSGPDVGAAFRAAGAPVNLPAGATLTPPTPTTSQMPVNPTQQAPAQMPGAMPGQQAVPTMQAPAQMPAMPGSMPAPTNVVPNHQFVQNVIGAAPQMPPAVAPQMPALNAPPPAVAQPVYAMTPAAQGFTREQYLAQPGWTDEILLQRGMMVRTA